MVILVICINMIWLIIFGVLVEYALKEFKSELLEITKCLDNKFEESWNEQLSLAEKYNIMFEDFNYIKQDINKLMKKDVLK